MPPAAHPIPLFQASSLAELVAAAITMGARDVRGWSDAEEAVVGALPPESFERAPDVATHYKAGVARGGDLIGESFCAFRDPETRRPMGATYTPGEIVNAMTAWSRRHATPVRVVDPGTGSGRFLVAAGRTFPNADLVGSELDPVASILARGHIAAAGLADRARIEVGDYRTLSLPEVEGRTLYLGNPPYVRHHLISADWKTWLGDVASQRGLRASKLAGLHVYFFLSTAETARPGDYGAFITSAEWLDVNYGRLVRDLLVGDLGVDGVHVIEPTALPFEDAQTTAVVTTFEVGAQPATIGLRRVADVAALGTLDTDQRVHRDRLAIARRWTPLTRTAREFPDGFVELGELCRVHRGQVTGANKVWIEGNHSTGLPDDVLFPSVTRARELFEAGNVLDEVAHLRRVIDLPEDLDELDKPEREAAESFLLRARKMGAHKGYVARHRRAWWSVGLRDPAPILATYMARRAPAFVRNGGDARHINVAHGLYPRAPLSDEVLESLAAYLSESTTIGQGRTYAGGLTKFEPKEMERLMVPAPEVLADSDHLASLTAEWAG